MNKILIGAIAGTLATIPMTAVMVGLHRLIPKGRRREELPPEQITIQLAEAIGAKKIVDEEIEQKLVSLINHFGYGAAAGAVYGLFAKNLNPQSVQSGIGFGLTVWTGSYLGWLPLFNILRSATKHPASQNILMIAAHIAWGAALGFTFKEMNGDEK